jgi:hypothetical protein
MPYVKSFIDENVGFGGAGITIVEMDLYKKVRSHKRSDL